MPVDYSLLGGAETPFPPTRTLIRSGSATPSLTTSSDDEELEIKTPGIASPGPGKKDYLTAAGKRQEMPQDPNDFLWMLTEEPHRSRRKAILKAHPEVRKLMGYTRWTLPCVLLVLGIQLGTAFLLRDTHPITWQFLLAAYVIGGTANQNIFLAIHEITHNLAFKRILPNKVLAMVANVAIGVPYAMAFKGYHIEHHKFLGEDGIDTDLPSKWEAIVLNNVAGKTFFATFQILFYALRPGFIRSQRPTMYHLLNLLLILSVDTAIVLTLGWYPLFYLLISSFFAGSLHPCAGHFIAEHYLMAGDKDVAIVKGAESNADVKDGLEGIRELAQETTSYYGWLNMLCYNVGYHNEHHDFPSIPWTRLPQLHALAHEFYDPLPAHPSWPAVTWKFITDPRIGMWSRAKRASGERGARVDEEVWAKCQGKDGKLVPEVAEDEEMDKFMDEAVERGYGSDVESKTMRQRKLRT
ncbi:sphingolipid delta-4 desaturase [Naganishia albida]|nr:sphingolipid delta-4 desaturase [Naganishia albida]